MDTRMTALLLLLALVGCERSVFVPDEIEAKKNFESIALGTPESTVATTLGKPFAAVQVSKDKKGFNYTVSSSGAVQVFGIDEKKSWPNELKLLSKCRLQGSAVIYSNATVWALYVLNSERRVACSEVYVS